MCSGCTGGNVVLGQDTRTWYMDRSRSGVTEVMYAGGARSPGKDRFWEICRQHADRFYTAPTAIALL